MKRIITLIVVFLLIAVGLGLFIKYEKAVETASPTPTGTSYGRTISDGTITVAYTSGDFGLATTPGQVLVTAYIPPCDPNFNYCLYYIGSDYQNSNFESAGLRIKKRTDFATERLCLDTPPLGFDASTKPGATSSTDAYSTSVFSPLGDAGAGHYAKGALYRAFIRDNSSCYEFETRVGASQYANYPAGTITEFTASNEVAVQSKLRTMLDSITLKDSSNLTFPQAKMQ